MPMIPSRPLGPLLVVVCVAALTGCASLRPAAPTVPALSNQQQTLLAVNNWRLEGRIGVQTRGEGWSAHLYWEHDGRQDRLRVSGPLSQGLVSIVVQDDLILVNEGDGREEVSRDPDAMLRERLGFSVPLQSLRYWVLGIPAPQQEAATQYAETGETRRFQQSGWQLDIERFTDVGRLRLPQKATIRGHDLKLKLIADRWTVAN